jgi:hypothetical protein
VSHPEPVDLSGLELVWVLEVPVGLLAALLCIVGLVKFLPLGRSRAFTLAPNPGLGLIRASIVAAAAWFWWVLTHTADSQVQGAYVALYAALGLACLLWGGLWRPILGVWTPADVVERGNLAAALVLAGFLLGTAAAFGGALSGDDASCAGPRLATPLCHEVADAVGPSFPPGSVGTGGWHVVLAFFLLAYAELRANVALVDRIGGGLSRQARVDRDVSAGLLLGAVALASGLVAGRAAAGDYLGWGDAMGDYWRRLWPMALVPVVGTAVGFLTTGRPDRALARGATSALLVAGGVAWYAFT